jgi:hypothetical protein
MARSPTGSGCHELEADSLAGGVSPHTLNDARLEWFMLLFVIVWRSSHPSLLWIIRCQSSAFSSLLSTISTSFRTFPSYRVVPRNVVAVHQRLLHLSAPPAWAWRVLHFRSAMAGVKRSRIPNGRW